jgi:hypothetical protein
LCMRAGAGPDQQGRYNRSNRGMPDVQAHGEPVRG